MRELLPWGGHHLYDRLVGRPLAAFYDRLAADMPAGRVLDVGCGPGHLAAALAGRARDVVALDKDPAQVRIARRNHPEVDVRLGDAADLPFPDACFDVVVTSESFHHWNDRAAGVAEAWRVLRPGGVFLIIEGAGDVNKAEMTRFLGRRPWPGLATLTRSIFRVHGFTPRALETELQPVLAASPFRGCAVRRIDGWWRVEARKSDRRGGA